jgi:putative tricarboxylic transport membrane protein
MDGRTSIIKERRVRLMKKRDWKLVGIGFLIMNLVFLSGSFAFAQEKFPSRTIEVANMFGPGGGTDIFVRTLAIDARKILKVPIVISNMTAGQGVGATKYVLDQPADGYTLLAFGPEQIFNAILGRIDYKDFEGVIMCQQDQSMFYVSKENAKFKTIQEVIRYAKTNPGKIKIGGTGAAGFDEVLVEQFNKKAGVDLTYVPYESASEAKAALVGGHIDLLHEEPGVIISLIDSGTIVPIIVFTDKRLKRFPNVPTGKELGIDITFGRWRGLAVKKGTSKERIKILHDAFKKAMDSEVYKSITHSQLLDLRPGYLNSEDFTKFWAEQEKIYSEIIKPKK